MNIKDIGEEIYNYRKKHRINQQEFAHRAGIAMQTVSSIERGDQKPQAATRSKIEAVLRGQEYNRKENGNEFEEN